MSTEVTTIPTPNVEGLPKHDFKTMLSFTVVDDATMELARNYAKDAKAFVESAKEEFYGTKTKPGPVKLADEAHKSLTSLYKRVVGVAEQVVDHCRIQIGNHLAAKEAARRALEAKLQREAQAAADAEAKRKQEAEALIRPPWEVAAAVAEAPAVAIAPTVTIARESAPEGIQERKKPWDVEVFDFQALIAAVAADPSKQSALEANLKFLKMEAAQMGEHLTEKYPGVKAVRGTTVALR